MSGFETRNGRGFRATSLAATALAATAAALATFFATRSWECAVLIDLAVGYVARRWFVATPASRTRDVLIAIALPASAAVAFVGLAAAGVLHGVALAVSLAIAYSTQLGVAVALTPGAHSDDRRRAIPRVVATAVAIRSSARLEAASAIAAAIVGVCAAVYVQWAFGAPLVALAAGTIANLVVVAIPPDARGRAAEPAPRSLRRATAHLIAGVGSLVLVLIGALLVVAMQPYTPMLLGVVIVGFALALARSAWRPLGWALGSLVAIAAVGLAVSQLTASTPPIVDATGARVQGSVASVDWVRLHGVEQAIVVRGRSADNPVLLVINGGPGPTQLAWHRQYLTALEDYFTVIYWEQRGSGKSGGLVLADWDRMTPEQYTADGLELTAHLRERFGEERIYVAGQSWGTMLGVWMVQQRPDWFAAYVGIGQMTSPVEDDTLIFDVVRDRAQSEGDTPFVRSLDAQGRPPYNGFLATTKYGGLFARAKDYETALVAASEPAPIEPLVGMTDTPEYGLADKVGAYLNGAITFARVYDQLDGVDFDSQVASLGVPVYLAEGRWDTNAMPELAVRWFDRLQAPSKTLVWFEHSGHNPEHEEPAAFVKFMVERVLAETRR